MGDEQRLRVVMISLANELVTAGHSDSRERHLDYAERVDRLDIVVYTPPDVGGPEPLQLSDRLRVYPTRSAGRIAFPFDATRIAGGLIDAQGADLVTTQDPFACGLVGWRLKRRYGLPLHVQDNSVIFDNPHWLAERPLRNRAFYALAHFIARRADMVRVLNERERTALIQMGLDAERVWKVPFASGLERFSAEVDPAQVEAMRARLGLPEGARVLLWIGRPVPFKRVPFLVRAFGEVRYAHPDAHLLLVGNFTRARHATKVVQKLGLNDSVTFAGHVDHVHLPTVHRLADVYLHTSIYEGLGIVMLEAAASGLPVVATRSEGAVECVLDGQTGLITEPNDVGEFAEAVGRLLGDPARARRMGHAGRAHALSKFDRARNIERIAQMWAETVRLARTDGG